MTTAVVVVVEVAAQVLPHVVAEVAEVPQQRRAVAAEEDREQRFVAVDQAQGAVLPHAVP